MTGGLGAVVASAAVANLAVGCAKIAACPGVVVGDQVEFELYEGSVDPPRSVEEAVACAEQWGFAEGTTFRATIVGTRGEYDCKAGVLEIEQIDGWAYESIRLPNFKGGGVVLAGQHAVAKGGCRGEVELNFVTSAQQLDCDARGADGERCSLEFGTTPNNSNGDACPSFCSLDFDVRATRVQ